MSNPAPSFSNFSVSRGLNGGWAVRIDNRMGLRSDEYFFSEKADLIAFLKKELPDE
jgi:hypothetical protein